MTALLEVETRHLRISATFDLMKRHRDLVAGDLASEAELLELESHYARYMCVLVAGFAEQAVKVLTGRFAVVWLTKTSQTLFENKVRRTHGMNSEKLEEFVRFLDTSAWLELQRGYFPELQTLNSVASQRNRIAHGDDSEVTLYQIELWFSDLKRLVHELSVLLRLPETAA